MIISLVKCFRSQSCRIQTEKLGVELNGVTSDWFFRCSSLNRCRNINNEFKALATGFLLGFKTYDLLLENEKEEKKWLAHPSEKIDIAAMPINLGRSWGRFSRCQS